MQSLSVVENTEKQSFLLALLGIFQASPAIISSKPACRSAPWKFLEMPATTHSTSKLNLKQSTIFCMTKVNAHKSSVPPRLGTAETTTPATKFLLACILLCGKTSNPLMTYANKQCSVPETIWHQNQEEMFPLWNRTRQQSHYHSQNTGWLAAAHPHPALSPSVFSLHSTCPLSHSCSTLKSSKLKWHLPIIRHLVRNTNCI